MPVRVTKGGVLAGLVTGLIAVTAPFILCPEPALSSGESAGAGGEMVLGVSFRGRHRAYPLRYFSPPRVINDLVRQQEIAVFHDSERGVSTAYFSMVLGEPLAFSGAVTEAVADDLTTMTRWDMISGKAVGGNLVGLELTPLPVSYTTWTEWFSAHPETTVFSAGNP